MVLTAAVVLQDQQWLGDGLLSGYYNCRHVFLVRESQPAVAGCELSEFSWCGGSG